MTQSWEKAANWTMNILVVLALIFTALVLLEVSWLPAILLEGGFLAPIAATIATLLLKYALKYRERLKLWLEAMQGIFPMLTLVQVHYLERDAEGNLVLRWKTRVVFQPHQARDLYGDGTGRIEKIFRRSLKDKRTPIPAVSSRAGRNAWLNGANKVSSCAEYPNGDSSPVFLFPLLEDLVQNDQVTCTRWAIVPVNMLLLFLDAQFLKNLRIHHCFHYDRVIALRVVAEQIFGSQFTRESLEQNERFYFLVRDLRLEPVPFRWNCSPCKEGEIFNPHQPRKLGDERLVELAEEVRKRLEAEKTSLDFTPQSEAAIPYHNGVQHSIDEILDPRCRTQIPRAYNVELTQVGSNSTN